MLLTTTGRDEGGPESRHAAAEGCPKSIHRICRKSCRCFAVLIARVAGKERARRAPGEWLGTGRCRLGGTSTKPDVTEMGYSRPPRWRNLSLMLTGWCSPRRIAESADALF